MFVATVWLGLLLVAVKAHYLGAPPLLSAGRLLEYVRSLAAISYLDILFTAALAIGAHAAVALLARGPRRAAVVSSVYVVSAACAAIYAVANVVMFGVFGGFLTYPLLALVGDVRMVRSSVAAHATQPVVGLLVVLPVLYVVAVGTTGRWLSRVGGSKGMWISVVCLVAWVVLGRHVYATQWATRADRRIAENSHWLLVSSWVRATHGDGAIRMAGEFSADDLADFSSIGPPPPAQPGFASVVLQRAANVIKGRRPTRPAPPNVVLVVLESVAARWASLNNPLYGTTPVLKAEADRAVVFDNVYAPIGRSSNSLAAMLLSTYPKLDFRDLTEEYPRLPGTSLARLFRDRGYRTAFATPSDLEWAGWNVFLKDRGFDAISDYHDLSCPDLLSSWGVEDRCMVDAMLHFLEEDTDRPFFLMGWTTQTHHPYEPSPSAPILDLVREPVADEWDLGRYLNVLHETDRQLGRLFDALRRTGLDQNTIVIVTGDHGQAFGYPHDTYVQGRTVYEEDVHVPLMIWSPRTYRSAARSKVVGGLVDLAPTVADLTGLPLAADWQGRSFFDARRSGRAYFYVAEDQFTLGVREGKWKYILSLREGVEELYDLDRDPTEQHNLAQSEPERCARLRQRLTAWTEANRRQYASALDAAVR